MKLSRGRLFDRKLCVLVVLGVLWLCAEHAAGASLPAVDGLQYSHVVRKEPRPLQVHVLKVDLRKENLELNVQISADPDCEGAADTVLTPPLTHARRGEFVAGVNANAWRMVPRPARGEHPRYVPGAACEVMGWVVTEGDRKSTRLNSSHRWGWTRRGVISLWSWWMADSRAIARE